ncbi:MAG: peptidylprolyl isomerase [Acidobacteriota bacterium]
MRFFPKSFLLRPVLWGTPVLLLAAACGESAPPADDVLATYGSAAITVQQVERASLARRAEPLVAEQQLEAYRQTARRLATRAIILERSRSGSSDPQLPPERLDKLRRESLLALFLERRSASVSGDFDPASVETFYEEHRERFRQDGRRQVWHLFRRHRPGEEPADTNALLISLRERIDAGATFMQLAQEYSDSETRLLGGRLGWILEGRLPAPLEKIVFGLALNEVSDPIPVPGGAAIFQVTEIIEKRDYPLEDVRLAISRYLRQRALRDALLEDLNPPETSPESGDLVLEGDALIRLLQNASAEEEVLRLGEYVLTAGEFREVMERLLLQPLVPWQPTQEEQIERIYAQQVEDQRLYIAALEEGFPRAGDQAELERRLRFRSDDAEIDRWIEEEIRRRIRDDAKTLRGFYEDNAFLYQSPPSYQLESLLLPIGKDVAAQLEALERARASLIAGETTLADVAERFEGAVSDLGWVGPARLQTFEPKVRHYVLGLGATGYTIPFQLNDRLSMVWVKGRRPPEQLAYDDVVDRVAEDYFDRHRQRFYRDLADQLLEDEGFRFYADRVDASAPAAEGESAAAALSQT